MSQRQKILLLEDVYNLGRSGDVVVAKAGFVRNFLLPKKIAVVAGKHTLMIQERLKEARVKRAITDRKESDELAARIEGMMLIAEVKVDPEGKLYGSVSIQDIVKLFASEGYQIEKKFVDLKHPIKDVGIHNLKLKLKEDATASFQLKVVPEGLHHVIPSFEKSALEKTQQAPQETKE